MTTGNGQMVSVPPGFRFHPTEEELVHYYLKKKVSYEAIDLQVIREVDLNKIEPWDLKDKCRIGTCPQNDFYFFSHKDKKYPSGTRTNRATTVGFWKATGRDKAVHLTSNSSKRIGMRKTLVFYTGRAPNGHKTDWIMHEYRLDDHTSVDMQQENGWVVCRVFKKKSINYRGFQQDDVSLMDPAAAVEEDRFNINNLQEDHDDDQIGSAVNDHNNRSRIDKVNFSMNYPGSRYGSISYSNLLLPQLLSHDHQPHNMINNGGPSSILNFMINNNIISSLEVDGSDQSALRLSSSAVVGSSGSDWCFLEKLLANNHPNDHEKPSSHLALINNNNNNNQVVGIMGSSTSTRLPLHYLGCEQGRIYP